MIAFKDGDVGDALLVKCKFDLNQVPYMNISSVSKQCSEKLYSSPDLERREAFYSLFALFAASLEIPKRQDGTIRDLTLC